MSLQIRLRQEQLADFKLICEIPREQLLVIHDSLRDSVTVFLRSSDLSREIENVIEDKQTVDALLRQSLSLHRLAQQSGHNYDEVLDALHIALETGLSEAYLNLWETSEDVFASLVELRPIRTVAKATDLSYEYQNLLQNTRILCDLRPLFSDDLTFTPKIDAAVVSFTLRIYSDSRDGNHSVSLALDQADIKALKDQCERALKKADILKQVSNQRGITTIICGEPQDA